MWRTPLTYVLAAAAILVATAATPASAKSRNVLLLISDDHGPELGCYGHKVIKTPHLDRLATEGVRFTHAFATVASCSASRSVIYTGLFNHTNGQFGHQHGYNDQHTHKWVRGIGALLRPRGYHTGIVGKYHVQPHSVYGFDEHITKGTAGARNVTEMAKATRTFLSARGDEPFLLVVGFSDPHRARVGFGNTKSYPGVSPPQYDPKDVTVPPFLPDTPEAREELADYYQAVGRMDAGVGMVLDALEATGHADDTLVLYFSDNGIAFPGAKTTLYDPGIRLPFIVRSPEQKRRGLANHAMVSYVDIVPTILDWTGAKPPKYELPGRSFLPVLEQENPKAWDTIFASHVFHEITMYYPMRVIRTRHYKYIRNLAHWLPYPFASDLQESKTWQSVLKGKASMYGARTVDAYVHRPAEELYDLDTDPNEVRNLIDDPTHAKALKDLRQRLRAFQQRTKDPWIVKYRYE